MRRGSGVASGPSGVYPPGRTRPQCCPCRDGRNWLGQMRIRQRKCLHCNHLMNHILRRNGRQGVFWSLHGGFHNGLGNCFAFAGWGYSSVHDLPVAAFVGADAEEAGGGFEFADVPVHAVDGKARGFGEFADGHVRHGADDGQDFLGAFRGAGGRGEGDGVVFLVVFPAVPTAASPLAVRARKMDEATRRRDDEGVEGEERRTTTVCARALSSVRRLVGSSRDRERAAAAKKTRPRVEARSVLGLRAGPAQPRPIMLKTRTKRATVSTTPRVIR